MLPERTAAADPNDEEMTDTLYLRLIQLIDEHTPDEEDDDDEEDD